MNTLPIPKPLVVIILDGWGISLVQAGNAIAMADTPTMDMFARHYPSASILAASIEVGLPWGEVGNSETGHSNIGAGQVRYQMLPKINQAIANRTFFANPVLQEAVKHAEQNNSKFHLMGLIGPGGVHAHSTHLYALLELLADTSLRERVMLHIFTDGRDTLPQSALGYVKELEQMIGKFGVGRIASLTGRLYAMDRNQNWERTKATYDMLTGGPRGPGTGSAEQALQTWYAQGESDEMLPPTAITRGGGPIAEVKESDSVFYFNFRPDRARQLTQAFIDPTLTGFERTVPHNLYFATMTQYNDNFSAPAAFIDESVANPLARIISEQNLRQLHIAETEKYAHVTYYLNGGHEDPFPGEEHQLIQSATAKNFADVPHMEAQAITDTIMAHHRQQSYDVYFVNYANADMVGHTGNFEAAVEACAFVDAQLAKLYQTIVPAAGALLVIADHGNAEEMLNPQTGAIETDHTSNPVPLHFVYGPLQRRTPRSDKEVAQLLSSPIGVLSDITPTVLDILDISKPSSMTGISLLDSLQ
jgi:2,3-bisphosphoglycerate-independent phosphoglycerate mutase